MSKQRAKGTRGENHFMSLLALIWPDIERAPLKGILDAGDFVNVPFPVESKFTAVPRILPWMHVLRAKAADHRFVLLWKGDTRTSNGRAIMTVDLAFGLELLQLWERRHQTNGRRKVEIEGQESMWPVE